MIIFDNRRYSIEINANPLKQQWNEEEITIMKEIRTPRGKLVGKLNERTGALSIKDGSKVTLIEIPPGGLRLQFTAGDGVTEEVFIPPVTRTTIAQPIQN
jgi:hypothetical protein